MKQCVASALVKPRIVPAVFLRMLFSFFLSSTSAAMSRSINAGFFYFSAPASPTAAKCYADLTHNPCLKDANLAFLNASSVLFEWEASPGVPKSRVGPEDGNEFEFDFSGQLERTSLCADELFDGGRIRPLKPPPGLQVGSEWESELSDSLRFWTAHSLPRASRSNSFFASPRRKQQAVADPFTKVLEEAWKARSGEFDQQRRGRD